MRFTVCREAKRGGRVVAEALASGHQATGVVRNLVRIPAATKGE